MRARHPGWIDVDDGPRQRLRRAFVGRQAEMRGIARAMGDPRLVAAALTGDRGIGKTRLLDEAVHSAGTSRYAPIRVTGTRATSQTAFAAFAGYLPPTLATPPISPYAYATAADLLRRTAPGRDLLLAVDDVGYLDDASVTLLTDMARQGGAFVLVSLGAGMPAPDPIAALSHAGLIDWLELAPLSRDDVAGLVGSALDGQVDGLLIQRLWEETAGNPLLLREVVTAQLDAGALTDQAGLWRLAGDLAVPVGLVRLIHERTSTLPSGSLHALELLAFGDGIRIDDLCEATSAAAVEAAEAHGSIRVDYTSAGDAYVRLTYPLYGSVLRATMPRVRAGARRAEVDAMTGGRRGAVPTARAEAGTVAAAAWDAWTTREVRRARDLSLHAAGTGAALDVIEPLGYSLMLTGSADEAERLLGALPATAAGTRSRIVRVRAINAHFGLGQAGRAHALANATTGADEPERLDMTALRALLHLLDGDPRTAAATAHPAMLPPARPATIARATVIRALSEVFGEHAVGSGRRLADALDSVRGVGAEAGGETPWLETIAELALVHELLWTGDLTGAARRADDGYAAAVASGRVFDIVVFCLLRAVVSGQRGAVGDQVSHCREGLALARDADLRPFIPVLLAALAHGEALSGDPVAAAATMAEAESRRDETFAILLPWLDLYAIWAVPDGDERASLARHAAESAYASGAAGFEAIACHDLARLGDADEALPRLRELADACSCGAAGAYAEHAEALRTQDITALGAVSERFAAMGAPLYAAEAAAAQSHRHVAAGRRSLATAALTRSVELIEACSGLVRLPAVATVDVPRITSREREIAVLAADGMSSKEIGRRLVLSVRTVENHLQRVYRKLGIGTRAELARRRPMLAAAALEPDPVNGSH
jgi:DNA-binding NarL/FixJ family response regulator